MDDLNLNDYKILQILIGKDGKGMSKIRGVTKKELAETSKLSLSKIKNTTKMLISLGLIDEGVMKVRAKTYYITQKGVDALKEIKKKSIKIK